MQQGPQRARLVAMIHGVPEADLATADRAQFVLGLQEALPVSKPRTWLMTKGWLMHGKISIDERPRGS